MEPIFCLNKAVTGGVAPSCLVNVKNRLFYPVLLSISPSDGKQCRCVAEGLRATSPRTECDITPQLVVSLVSFPNDLSSTKGKDLRDGSGNDKTVRFASAMASKFAQGGGGEGDGDLAIIDWVYPAVYSVYTNSVNGTTYSGFEHMCNAAQLGHKNCIMLLSYFLVTPDQFLAVNPNNIQLTALQTPNREYPLYLAGRSDDDSPSMPSTFLSVTCTNTIYIPSALQQLRAQPPVSLVQPYQKCSATLATAAQVALGAAAGSAGLYAGILFSILVSIAVWRINGGRAKRGEQPLMPPLKKSLKAARDVNQAIDGLRHTMDRVIDLLSVPEHDKIKLRRELNESLHVLEADEDRVPLTRAIRDGMEIVSVDKRHPTDL